MAQRYKERLLQGSGISNRKFESQFGMKMLKKMGWTEGKGLGKGETGITDCVQLKRREDGMGLGQEDRKNFNWNDNWWDSAFNSAIKKLQIKKKAPVVAKKQKESSTSSDEEEHHKKAPTNTVQRKKIAKITKRKQSCSSSSSSSNSSSSGSSSSEEEN